MKVPVSLKTLSLTLGSADLAGRSSAGRKLINKGTSKEPSTCSRMVESGERNEGRAGGWGGRGVLPAFRGPRRSALPLGEQIH